MAANCRSAKHYRKNAKSRAKKKAYDTAYMTSKEGLAYRAKHKRMRRKAEKKYGKAAIKGKDIEKSTGKPTKISVNRGRKEKSRLKGSKRKKRT